VGDRPQGAELHWVSLYHAMRRVAVSAPGARANGRYVEP
jgi:hypothetical protein